MRCFSLPAWNEPAIERIPRPALKRDSLELQSVSKIWGKNMPMVTLKQGCAQAIKWFLKENRIPAGIRIELLFTGCCDPSLGLRMDDPNASDLVFELEDFTFIMNSDTYETTGEITIDYVDDGIQKGFLLTSSKPVSEWQGFAPCNISRNSMPGDKI